MAGLPVYSQCDLIQFVRDHSACWEGKCPVYPTELVFALDQSSGITEQRFNETRDMIASIIGDLNIRESNCPVGAKVTVLSYDSNVSYLIRGSDYHSKRQLLQFLSQIRYQVPTEARDIGHAMRYVARHVFKRTRAGANVRRVAVFFSNGAATSRSSIITATMEFNALDISPAVFAFNERGFLDEAFRFDDTGTFQVIPVPPNGEYEPLERLQRCTLCYDKCFANACAREILLPEDSYMDVAFLIDNSRNLASDEFKALKDMVSLMIDNFNIASDPLVSDSGDRVALLSYPAWSRSRRNKTAVKTEFDFTMYSNQALMKDYIQTSLQQLNGEAAIGHALMWTMENLFSEAHSRRHKVIFVVSAGENHEKQEFVRKVALRAKCQGYVIFVISLGSTPTYDLEELASHPADHHLIQLGRIHKPDLNYIAKFLKPFVHAVRRGFNSYPPPVLEDACRLINSEKEDGPNRDVQFINELLEISSDENSFFSQELSAGKDSSFLLEDNGHGHLVYIPSQMVEPKILANNYDSDQGPTANAGQEKHGRTEESNLSFKPEDISFQEYYMDVAFLIDASQRVGDDEFKQVKAFVTSVLDYFHVTPDPLTSIIGDRVAVLSYSPSGYRPNTEDCPAYLEFDLLTYNSRDQMKHHLLDSVQQLNGDAFTGHALQWTIDNVFVGTPNLKKNKVIFIVSAGETNPVDKEVLRDVSQRAKCQGYTIFVFSFGPTHSDKELEELASQPLDHHLVQLGRTHKPDFNYVIKFLRPFVHSIRRAINSYPSDDLRAKCPNVTYPSPESTDTENTVFLIPEVYEIERDDSGLFGEPGSWERHFSALGNNQRNDSQTVMGLMQKLYMLFSTGDMMLKDKGEAQPEETPAPVSDQQDRKDGESTG